MPTAIQSRLAAGLVVALVLSLAGCGQMFLDPGPNPARVEVKLAAQVPESLKQYPSEPIYWDWGLYLVVEQGPLPLLKPVQPQQFKVIADANPLLRDTVFLAPPGQHTFRLLVSGYAIRGRGEGVGAVTLLDYSEDFKLNLPSGGGYRIQRRLGVARR